MRAEDFTFTMIPDPIAHSGRIGGPARRVWATVYSWRRMKRERWKLSGARLARLLGEDRRNLGRSIQELVDAGLLEAKTVTLRNGSTRTEFRDLWPDWLSEEGRRFALDETVGGDDADDGSDEPADPCVKGTQGVRQGDAGGASRGRSSKSPLEEPARRLQRDGSGEPSPEDLPDEEVNPDSGSRAAEEQLSREKAERAARKAERAARGNGRLPRVKVPASGEEFRETPSKRPEWNLWRDRDAAAWGKRDLVGYWVCRFAEVRGEEDREFFAASLSSGYAPAAMKLVSQFVSLNLGGGVKYREAVERVLAGAEAAGKPVSLRYFFGRPGNPETLASLDRPRGGRAPSPVEVNDAWGEDREHWDRKAAEIQEKRRRKAEKLGIPLSQVKLHVGEEV